jgi:hypothetical protein
MISVVGKENSTNDGRIIISVPPQSVYELSACLGAPTYPVHLSVRVR